MALNKIFLIGNMVADPELKQTANGIPVTSFRIAVNRKFTRQGEQPQTDFFDVVCWRQQAEFVCKWFSKGKQILIVGSMQSRSWTDQNGQKRYTWEVVADEISFVERRSSEAQQGGAPHDAYPPEPPVGYGSQQSSAPSYQPSANFSSAGSPGSFEEISSDDELPF